MKKFDFVVGNPPYHGDGKQQIYTLFYKYSIRIAKNVCLVFPVGWQEPKNGNLLSELNNEKIKRDEQIVFINNIHNAFKGVPGAEWTNIILWKEHFDNKLGGKQLVYTNGADEEIKLLPILTSEIKKPAAIMRLNDIVTNSENFESFSKIVSRRKPYGIPTNFFNKEDFILKSFENLKNKNDYFRVLTKYGYLYVDNDYLIPKISKSLYSYKVFVPYAWGNWDERTGLGGAFADVYIGYPSDAAVETFLEVGPMATYEEAYFTAKFLMTKFCRALLYVNKFSQHSTTAFTSIPIQKFNEKWWVKSIEDIDRELFSKYEIDDDIYNYVVSNFQTLDEKNIQNIVRR